MKAYSAESDAKLSCPCGWRGTVQTATHRNGKLICPKCGKVLGILKESTMNPEVLKYLIENGYIADEEDLAELVEDGIVSEETIQELMDPRAQKVRKTMFSGLRNMRQNEPHKYAKAVKFGVRKGIASVIKKAVPDAY